MKPGELFGLYRELSMAHMSRLVPGRFALRGERALLHGNALNLCVVMDTPPPSYLLPLPFDSI